MENSQNKIAEVFKITSNCKELKGRFSQLTGANLRFETGRENDLLKRVESRLKKNREEVSIIIKKGQTKTV